jgi:cytoskeletal protein CcmA (bactofilin family)
MFGSNKEKTESDSPSTKSNHLEKGTKVIGDIETTGNIRIDCDIQGNINAKAKLVLGSTADIQGNVMALNAEISGKVTGTIEIKELLTLRPTAIIDGDIIGGKINMETGATLNGKLKMDNSGYVKKQGAPAAKKA